MIAAFGLFPLVANAGPIIQCAIELGGPLQIIAMGVQGDREDGHEFQNTLVLTLGNSRGEPYQCGGKPYVHIENTSPAYSSILEIAKHAFETRQFIRIGINPSLNSKVLSHQISTIGSGYI